MCAKVKCKAHWTPSSQCYSVYRILWNTVFCSDLDKCIQTRSPNYLKHETRRKDCSQKSVFFFSFSFFPVVQSAPVGICGDSWTWCDFWRVWQQPAPCSGQHIAGARFKKPALIGLPSWDIYSMSDVECPLHNRPEERVSEAQWLAPCPVNFSRVWNGTNRELRADIHSKAPSLRIRRGYFRDEKKAIVCCLRLSPAKAYNLAEST